ncbi:hypothetical protein DPSP01_014604 [Paraphaeosphaeria sporulosa]
MVSYTSIALAATNLIGLTTASLDPVRYTGIVHRITAGSTDGNNSLRFEPQQVVAEIGDLIEFHFLPKNHTVVQSSFDKPCEPLLDDAIFSGFNFATPNGEADNVFTFLIRNRNAFWYYCSQTLGDHCQKGMSGVINQNPDGSETLSAYQEKAKTTVTKQPSHNQLESQGGNIIRNVPL